MGEIYFKVKQGHVRLSEKQRDECLRLANNYHKNRKIDQMKALEYYQDKVGKLLFSTLHKVAYNYDK
jgi:hypothetical protein